MAGEAVAQGMGGEMFFDACFLCAFL